MGWHDVISHAIRAHAVQDLRSAMAVSRQLQKETGQAEAHQRKSCSFKLPIAQPLFNGNTCDSSKCRTNQESCPWMVCNKASSGLVMSSH